MESLSVVSGSPTRFRTREARWRRFRRRAHLVFRGTHMRDRAPMQKSKDWKGEEEERARDRWRGSGNGESIGREWQEI